MSSEGYFLTEHALTVITSHGRASINRDHKDFEKVLDLVRQERYGDAADEASVATKVSRIVTESYGKLVAFDGYQLTYAGQALPDRLAERLIAVQDNGLPVRPVLNFIEQLMRNPSYRARRDLMDFLEYGELPITSDGYFLAYKRVRYDYKDVHSGTYDNRVGSIVTMPREEVDDDPNNTCSAGLHFCSIEYLRNFSGEKIMVLKINPRDVVSIPTDYSQTKGRCSRYTVVGELPEEDVRSILTAPINCDYDDEAYDDEAYDEMGFSYDE